MSGQPYVAAQLPTATVTCGEDHIDAAHRSGQRPAPVSRPADSAVHCFASAAPTIPIVPHLASGTTWPQPMSFR
jgi:hypothetical protein